jgi:hypothetical protein
MNTNQKVKTSKPRLSAIAAKTIGYTALLTLSLTVGMHYSQATPLQAENVYGYKQNQSQNDSDQLDAALAPIALYPDSLLTHILIASTYPLEVIEAARFIQQHSKFDLEDYEENGLSRETIEAIQEDALEYGWDASVVALTAFPDILNNMSDDLSWLSDLGDAFEEDQELVLSRVQKLRELAYDQGNLQNDEQVEVVVEQEQDTRVIVIQPRRHEVVYVPYYDTASIYGPSWHINSSYRWSRPYYARNYRYGHVYFSPAAYIGSRLLFGGIHWSNRHISINRDWSYRNARHYSYRNTHYKRVHHKEYQRWRPVKRHTRHAERQKYVGNQVGRNTSHKAFKRNKWVTNKHSEFANVRSSNKSANRSVSKSENRNAKKQKLYRKNDKTLSRQAKPAERTVIRRNDKQLKQANVNKSSQKAITKTKITREKRTTQQRQVSKPQRQASKPQRQASKPQRQVSKPQRQASKPQRQASKPQRQASKPQRQASKPQRQSTQRSKMAKR